ncbi:hypothetical protein PSA7680_01513 [Pseudoruegeria aquimaris]|uniref:DUF4386 domain-containing protein n=1 Tax=Pseudoruegeria aquimaris TaxID=393663 RepID=A0A1Y5S6R1_9RHOB|nr:hypothetical protein [Pseudoruegeria aquimaris]SLN31410.1 hypothetical protein PSA7680_01513 [Pseudoruegeria aquimaris]
MTLQTAGGACALICAATYIVGFALLTTLLAPLDYGSARVEAEKIVAFIATNGGLLITWNAIIYLANALSLAVLVVSLASRLSPRAPGWASVTHGFGLIWAALVLAAGMIANVTVERVAAIQGSDPLAAAALWDVLHQVELGLGGGNEIAGGVWIACVAVAGRRARALPLGLCGAGLVTGASGLATLWPAIGDAAGALFGLGAIAWFIAIGLVLLTGDQPRTDAGR